MTTLASLGISCQTAFQLARFAERNPTSATFAKGPIDWLICPPENLALWLDAGMPDFKRGEVTIRRGTPWWKRFDFERGEVTIRRGSTAWWKRFDIYFWHGFYTQPAQLWWQRIGNRFRSLIYAQTWHKSYLDIEANFARELSKLAYGRERFRSLDPATTLFFISNTLNSLATDVFAAGEEARYHFSEASLQTLSESLKRFYGVPVRLHCVTRCDRATASMLSKANVSVLTPDQSIWTGDDKAWDGVLEQCLRE